LDHKENKQYTLTKAGNYLLERGKLNSVWIRCEHDKKGTPICGYSHNGVIPNHVIIAIYGPMLKAKFLLIGAGHEGVFINVVG